LNKTKDICILKLFHFIFNTKSRVAKMNNLNQKNKVQGYLITSSLTNVIIRVFTLLLILLAGNFSAHSQSLVQETLGTVSVDTSLAHAMKILGKANDTSKEFYDKIAKCWVKVHFYDKAGVELEVCRSGRNYNIRSVRSVKSEIAKTSKGQGVGSDSQHIIQAYNNAKVIEDYAIVVEDKVRGIVLRFLLEDRKVYEVNLYKDKTIMARYSLRRNRLRRRLGM
jgi:hypothetical protein